MRARWFHPFRRRFQHLDQLAPRPALVLLDQPYAHRLARQGIGDEYRAAAARTQSLAAMGDAS